MRFSQGELLIVHWKVDLERRSVLPIVAENQKFFSDDQSIMIDMMIHKNNKKNFWFSATIFLFVLNLLSKCFYQWKNPWPHSMSFDREHFTTARPLAPINVFGWRTCRNDHFSQGVQEFIVRWHWLGPGGPTKFHETYADRHWLGRGGSESLDGVWGMKWK